VAHFFRDNAAKVLGALEETRWRQHIKFVLMTAEGHVALPMNHAIMQPLLHLRVQTWADFSNRLPSRQASKRLACVLCMLL
jgi:hypothetical protein